MATGAAAGGVAGQDAEAEPELRSPDGPLVLGLEAGRHFFLSGLPRGYLDGLTLGPVTSDEDLADDRSAAVSLGLRLLPRWKVEGEYVMAGGALGSANLDADVRYWSVNAVYSLPWDLFALAGAGSVSYDFEGTTAPPVARTNRDFALSIGVGARTPSVLGSPFAGRAEIRHYVSWFTVPGAATRVQHHLALTYGFEVSFP